MPCDLKGPQDALVSTLSGIDIVISAIFVGSLMDEIPLAEAAKLAGVKRFVQSAFMIILPPKGAVDFRDKVRVVEKSASAASLPPLHMAYSNAFYRKRRFLTTSRSFVSRTRILTPAGGTSLPCPDFHLAVGIMPFPRIPQSQGSEWMGMFQVHSPISEMSEDTLLESSQIRAPST